MGYGALSFLIIIFVALYASAVDKLHDAQAKNDNYEHAIQSYEESRSRWFKEQSDNYRKNKEDFAFIIKKQISLVQKKGLYSHYDPEDLCRMILENDYTIGVKDIQDIDFEHFENTIKAALYADKGLLQAYQSDSTQLYRIDQHGKHIPLSDEELEKMRKKDFDFIYDSLRLF